MSLSGKNPGITQSDVTRRESFLFLLYLSSFVRLLALRGTSCSFLTKDKDKEERGKIPGGWHHFESRLGNPGRRK
jgi:hypothetical protein